MQFLFPLALLSGALALVVLAFHIRRRRTITVPSLVIWRQLQAGQVQRNRIWQWPRMSWSLLLQLLALAAMVLALAQPILNRGPVVDHWIFVVDRSGTMQAVNSGGTLLDAAKGELTARLAAATGSARQSLIAVGAASLPVLVNQPLGGPGMADALKSIGPEDGPADWSKLDLALAPLVNADEQTRIVIYSDHAVTPALVSKNTAIEPVVLSTDATNAAISAQLTQDKSNPQKWTLSGIVRLDPGQASTEVIVGFAGNGREQPLEWTRRTIGDPEAVPSDEAIQRSFQVNLTLPGGGIVSARLADDGNVHDNVIHFVVGDAASGLDILYIGAGNQPLLTALRAIEGTQIFQAPRLPADLRQFGLVVVDNLFVERQPEGNVLWIGNAGIGGPELAPGSHLPPTAAEAAMPLMRGVGWTTIETGGSFVLPVAASSEVLLRSGEQPLITTEPSPHGRNVRLAFDPRNSSWAQQPSLPIFVSNLVDWLGIAPQGQLRSPCLVGATCALDRRYEGGSLTLLGGDTLAPIAVTSADWVPSRAGLYELRRDGRADLVVVNAALMEPVAKGETVEAEPQAFPLPLWPLLLVLAAVMLIAETLVSGRGAERFLTLDGLRQSNNLARRRRVALALHIVTLALLAAAFVNAPLPWRQAGETLVQIVASGGTVDSGSDAVIMAGPTPDLDNGATPDRTGPIGEALVLAAATVPWDRPGHIVVTGDTASGEDELAGLAEVLSRRDIVVDVQGLSGNVDAINVAALEAPEPVFAGDTVQLVGVVHASQDMQANLRFERDGEILVEQSLALTRGDNRVETILTDVTQGSASYKLTVTSPNDLNVANNGLSRIIDARGAGEIAVIANDPARGDAFVDWLASQDIAATAIEPKRVPYRANDWKAFDGAVLLDVPAIALTTLQQEQLEQAVAEQGLGLMILGGPNSFGPGGYLETPLENASPLSSRVPRDAPEATLVFVLDRSGSMQQPVGNGTRLDIAKQATLAAIRLLNRNSQVGIIVFDSEPTVVLPLSRIDNADMVTAALTGVDPGGGTSVYPGLAAAYDMLRDVDTPARHIIVMTDGLSQPADFPSLLSQIRGAGISVSSVSIGEGAERGLIEQIARLGGGAFHATDDFAALPSILSQEAMLLSGSPIELGQTQPLWASRSEPFLRGLPATMPMIDGFVLTTAKPEAALAMVVPDSKGEPMPLLASWRFGAGQVLALTTEAVGPWSANWQRMDAYAPFWAQVVRQFLPGVERGHVVLDLVRRGDGIVADIAVRKEDLGTPVLTVSGPDGLAMPLSLSRVGALQYRATFHPPTADNYRFEVIAGTVSASRTFAMNYPYHLGPTAPDQPLRRLAIASNGQVDIAAPARRDVPDSWTMVPAGLLWLGLAIALFMLALTVRYTRLFVPVSRPIAPHSHPSTPARSVESEPVHI
ncbi:vWA domain-containing protein [Devosia faecipullorum]|uniref:vWA domain-containing protein n=1 Tax=Devosia faecipullorum TaxID=2755039 RepID=UPI00187B1DD7|nr:vWA domain-containing protein [Devosia faecipullorum]MBE7733177.1 VWA domain-containing protein [Devosia faecipullorum]